MSRPIRVPRLTVTDSEVRAALRLRYPAGTFALMQEVGNGTGFKCNRHADAVAVGLWPSRGLFAWLFIVSLCCVGLAFWRAGFLR